MRACEQRAVQECEMRPRLNMCSRWGVQGLQHVTFTISDAACVHNFQTWFVRNTAHSGSAFHVHRPDVPG